jgi:hypothetical protein
MKFLKIVLIILVVIAAVFFAGGQFLPNNYSVSRTTVIKAEDSVVYKNVVDFNNFLKWNPWSRMEPTAWVDITGDAGTPGHFYQWNGKELGKGHMKIQEVKPYKAADFQLTFEEPFKSEAQNHFSFEKVAEGTKVTWSMQGQSDATVDKWMYLTMDQMIGKDFDSGLQNLKELSEKTL